MDMKRSAEFSPSLVAGIALAAIGEPAHIAFGPFVFLPTQQLLLNNDQPVRLGSRAVVILFALLRRAGDVVSKDELLETAWPGLHVDDSNLRVHIAALRKALGDGRYIQTVPLRGYCFVAPVVMRDAVPATEPVTAHPPVPDLSRQLAEHATLLDGLIAGRNAVQVTQREAALLGLQILALDAAILQLLGSKQQRSA
jgi:DNA-binding winged helix-turn-helix (wHTH) protein